MSISTMLVASHLNEIQAGRCPLLELPQPNEQLSALSVAQKTAIVLICMGRGLVRMPQITQSDRPS